MSTFYQKKMKQNGFLKDTRLFKDDNILTRQTGLMTGAYSAWWYIILWLPTVSKQSLLSALTSMSSVVLFYINYIHAEGICFVGNKNWNNSPINRTQTVGLHSVPDSSRLSRRGGGWYRYTDRRPTTTTCVVGVRCISERESLTLQG